MRACTSARIYAMIKDSVVALGTFDGVHRGHRKLICQAIALASQRGFAPLIYTFSNHPMEAFGRAPVRLMPDAVRLAALSEFCTVSTDVFDLRFAAMSPEGFVRMLIARFNMRVAVAGFNYTFGKSGIGNMETLRYYGEKYGFEVVEIPPVRYGVSPISSTRIRTAIEAGNVADAAEMLGREYRLSGPVVMNRRFGHTLGFPTANIDPPASLVMPRFGVYATWAEVGDAIYPAVTNIGENPTVQGDKVTIETHLLGFNGDIYGEKLSVRFMTRLRGDVKFSSTHELVQQIHQDVSRAKSLLNVSGQIPAKSGRK